MTGSISERFDQQRKRQKQPHLVGSSGTGNPERQVRRSCMEENCGQGKAASPLGGRMACTGGDVEAEWQKRAMLGAVNKVLARKSLRRWTKTPERNGKQVPPWSRSSVVLSLGAPPASLHLRIRVKRRRGNPRRVQRRDPAKGVARCAGSGPCFLSGTE